MKRSVLLSAFAILVGGAAAADEIVVPRSFEQNQPADFAYRFDRASTGHGFLEIEWSGVAGRTVERRRMPLNLTDASEVVFSLDIRRAVAAGNELVAHLSFDGVDQIGNTSHRENKISAQFIAPPADHPWSDYQIIIWQGQTPAGYATLKKLGITAGMVETNHRVGASTYTASLAPLIDADLRCYLENIATDFYSPYHKWYDDRPANWRFLEAKQRYWANPATAQRLFASPASPTRNG